jgi:hypothetical protein
MKTYIVPNLGTDSFWKKWSKRWFLRKNANTVENFDHNIDPWWVCEKNAQNYAKPIFIKTNTGHLPWKILATSVIFEKSTQR